MFYNDLLRVWFQQGRLQPPIWNHYPLQHFQRSVVAHEEFCLKFKGRSISNIPI